MFAKNRRVRTVHPHVTEEEAFLALAETAGNTDLAIGKLTDLRFYRDVNAVSNLQKKRRRGSDPRFTDCFERIRIQLRPGKI